MNIRHWFVLGVLGCAQLTAIAQQVPEQQRPQDADAVVPAVTYTSAFVDFSSAASDQDRTPDKEWRFANEQLANPETGPAHHEQTKEGQTPSAPANAQPVQHQHQHEDK